jgi:nucleotide-binding universal stress UspA family protein
VETLSNDAKITLQAYLLDAEAREQILYERVDRARENLEERLDKFWKELTEEDRKVSKQIASVNVCESYPPEEILKKAVELNCDLIVMGTHEKGLTHTFLGSVAKSVLHRSHIPTLVVPLPEELPKGDSQDRS